jgi:hypothetical protein
MSLTAPELTGRDSRTDALEGPWVSPVRRTEEDTIVVTCAACGERQHAPGRASGYTCESCDASWRVLRCPGCAKASIVAAGVSACPRCGHDHRAPAASVTAIRASRPAWLTEPEPLSVWLGGVKYLGGHNARQRESTTAGLLLDPRGIHLRAFAELFTIPWQTVTGVDIEGPSDISDRLTLPQVVELGASTWALRVAYLTVHTPDGDAIFEIDGLGPPEVHARLSRVLQGLQRAEHPPTPIAIDRSATGPVAVPTPAASPVATPAISVAPVVIDPATSDAPLEILVVDALWKLDRVRETGLVDDAQAAALRNRILAQVPELTPPVLGTDGGPLLHV